MDSILVLVKLLICLNRELLSALYLLQNYQKNLKYLDTYFFHCPFLHWEKKIMVYNRGEEIFRCQPYAFIILFSLRKYLCDFCLKYCEDPNNLKKCSSCKMVYYCSKNCQGNAWLSYHSQECKIHLKVQEHHPLDQIMVPIIYFFDGRSPSRHKQNFLI